MNRRIFLLLALAAAGCATIPQGPPPLAEGWYFFDCPIFYERGLAQLTHLPNGNMHLELIERHKGSFDLQAAKDGEYKIVSGKIPLADIPRSIRGTGHISGQEAKGEAVIWTTNLIGISRDHRKGEWTLTPAAPGQYESRLKKIRKRDEARRAAAEAKGGAQ